ncbi:MAG: hypothetical protein HRU18_03110 [Pseudoalteromonas sp.]|uniref:hypothetical protein n=1 Tax=Pseudoalteromonas sp. TaxID=53249 RepID=UPI001D1E545E|nr:hypothetical protein [Pseudoalteromonas sp.]NRA77174.1 hypothetical protein [Pseudoalteromonas sp.]
MDKNEFILNLILLGLKKDPSDNPDGFANGYESYMGESFTIDILQGDATRAEIFIPNSMSDTSDGKYLKSAGDKGFTFNQVLKFIGIFEYEV